MILNLRRRGYYFVLGGVWMLAKLIRSIGKIYCYNKALEGLGYGRLGNLIWHWWESGVDVLLLTKVGYCMGGHFRIKLI